MLIFAAELLEEFIAQVYREQGNGPLVRAVVGGIRERFAANPATITVPIAKALEKCGLTLAEPPPYTRTG